MSVGAQVVGSNKIKKLIALPSANAYSQIYQYNQAKKILF